MKKYIMILFAMVFLAGTTLQAQETRKERKSRKKAEKEAMLEENYKNLVELAENKNFVLEADYISNQYGHRSIVTPTLNFIMVDEDKAVIQIGDNVNIGANGVGGVTAEGKISNYEVIKNEKNGTVMVKLNLMSTIGVYDIFVHMSPGTNSTATVTGIRSGRLNYTGELVALENSDVFKGQSF